VTHRRDEAVAEGRPEILLRDEDREAIAELLADLLVDVIERERQERG